MSASNSPHHDQQHALKVDPRGIAPLTLGLKGRCDVFDDGFYLVQRILFIALKNLYIL